MSDTTALFYSISIYVLFFGIIFWNYGQFTKVVLRWTKKPIKKKGSNVLTQPKLPLKDSLKCYIPYYQVCIVCKSLYGTSRLCAVFSIISAAGIIINLFNKFVYAINGYVMLFTSIFMMVAIVMFLLIYGIVTANCARLYGFGIFSIILCFLFPHICCFYLTNNIPDKMRALHKEEIFREHTGDTVIKQRHNK